jgi:hypothetical protein
MAGLKWHDECLLTNDKDHTKRLFANQSRAAKPVKNDSWVHFFVLGKLIKVLKNGWN